MFAVSFFFLYMFTFYLIIEILCFLECFSDNIHAFYECKQHDYKYCIACYDKEQMQQKKKLHVSDNHTINLVGTESSTDLPRKKRKHKDNKQGINKIFATHSFADVPQAISEFADSQEILYQTAIKQLKDWHQKVYLQRQSDFERKLVATQDECKMKEEEFIRLIRIKHEHLVVLNNRCKILSQELEIQKDTLKDLGHISNIRNK